MLAKMRNMGEACTAANRFLVQDSIYDTFAEKLVAAVAKLKTGDGMEKDVQVGPLINQQGLEKVEKHIADALDNGATLLQGGNKIGGLFFEPTVLANVPSDALIAREETFGPLIALFRFHDEEEGIRMANATEYGLAAYFFSQNVKRCWRVSEQIDALETLAYNPVAYLVVPRVLARVLMFPIIMLIVESWIPNRFETPHRKRGGAASERRIAAVPLDRSIRHHHRNREQRHLLP